MIIDTILWLIADYTVNVILTECTPRVLHDNQFIFIGIVIVNLWHVLK